MPVLPRRTAIVRPVFICGGLYQRADADIVQALRAPSPPALSRAVATLNNLLQDGCIQLTDFSRVTEHLNLAGDALELGDLTATQRHLSEARTALLSSQRRPSHTIVPTRLQRTIGFV